MIGVGLPDVITIGAMKCGTSALHTYMRKHPEISMSRPKEPNFFVDDPVNGSFHKGLDWYAGLFPAGTPIRGESSTSYTKAPRCAGVPARMHGVVPDAKLIYILRDPIDRCVSHWMHRYANLGEPRPLAEALAAPDADQYLDVSRYASQLERFLPYYPLERVLVLDLVDLQREPHATMREVFSFLGVDADFTHDRFLTPKHETARKVRPNAAGALVTRALGIKRMKVMRHQGLARRTLFRAVDRPIVDEPTRARLTDVFAPDVERLRALTGKPFAHWSL